MDSSTCSATDFLNPNNFRTSFDTPGSDASQYAKGLETARNAKSISIGVNGVWGARMLDGASLVSYERIGYHRSTAALLRGFLDSGVLMTVYRQGQEPVKIKG